MKISFVVSKRLTVRGDEPGAYLRWEEQIRNIPRVTIATQLDRSEVRDATG